MKTLEDNQHRRIDYLRISITDRCNLRCRYCMPEHGIPLLSHNQILTYEEIIKIVKIFVNNGIKKIRITGGEPLVRKNIENLIAKISSIEGVKDLGLTTNGVLLKELSKKIYDAGLNRINISLDSLHPGVFESITRRPYFYKVWDGIMEAIKTGFDPIKINVVVIRGVNDTEIPNFLRLAMDFPLVVRFIEYMPIGENNDWSYEKVMPVKEIKNIIENYVRLEPLQPNEYGGPAQRFAIYPSKGEIGFISPVSEHFCDRCNRLRLTADGKIRTCLFSDDEIDLKPALKDENPEKSLLNLLKQALQRKPPHHNIVPFMIKKCQRFMNSVGG